ncbi:MAG: SDR family oxidoreductase [Syntrophorhabdaceae bacterium]|nr:SDR family oxidoreductase [Syntrophorhabdaceae bacterium]
MKLLKDRVAIVTGGGRGIGRAIAFALSREGAKVALAGRTVSSLEETWEEIGKKKGKAIYVKTDVTDENQVIDMVAHVAEKFGKIDILVNNSGITGPTLKVMDMALDKWNETIAVDLTGAMLCAREVLKYMVPKRRGVIINIVSEGGRSGDGRSGFPMRSAYCASKMGLIGLTETLSIEVGEYNIRVNGVSPGPVNGGHLFDAMRAKAKATGKPFEEIMEALAASCSLKRLPEEWEVAEAVVFLASDLSSGITGQILPVSCGQHIRL